MLDRLGPVYTELPQLGYDVPSLGILRQRIEDVRIEESSDQDWFSLSAFRARTSR